jgi:neutral ceramidase
MSSPKYSQVPTEEKVDDEQRNISRRSSRASALVLGLGSFIILSSLVIFFLGFAKIDTVRNAASDDFANAGSESSHEYETRATGDPYLLGVGKADITGYEMK